MKELKNLTGAKMISKKEQKEIKGGWVRPCVTEKDCPIGYGCLRGICVWGV